MDRDLVLAGLLIIGVTLTLLSLAPWTPAIAARPNARNWERAMWRSLWWPSVPVVGVASVLIGWAIVEPATSDEPLPLSAFVMGVLFLALWVRVLLRAGRALRTHTPVVAGTVGLWHPRVVVSVELAARLDSAALGAALAHERAHARHRDPLRILLAQIMTDLQWPWPVAKRRFDRWRQVLELARDEEARIEGADGSDLAAAVLAAASLRTARQSGASLIDDSAGLEDRILRLLAPIAADEGSPSAPGVLALIPVSLVGVMSGMRFGDGLVQAIVKWL